MIPHPWHALILALAMIRLMRLAGWDDFPLAIKSRDWLTGAEEYRVGSTNAMLGQSAEQPTVEIRHKHPTLAHFLGCAFCLGFWIDLVVYGAWLAEPKWTVIVCVPFAFSTVTGLVNKNLDP